MTRVAFAATAKAHSLPSMALLVSALAVAACSSTPTPSAPDAGSCQVVLSGAVSYSGSCAVNAQYNEANNQVVLTATIPDAGASNSFAATLIVAEGTAFDAGTFTPQGAANSNIAICWSEDGGSDCHEWSAKLGGATGMADQGTMLLAIDSVGSVSTVNGAQTWNNPQGSLVAVVPDPGDLDNTTVRVSMNFSGSATALPDGVQAVADAGATVSDQDGYIQSGTFPITEVSAFSNAGVTVLEIGGGSEGDGGTDFQPQYNLNVELGTLATGTYTSANVHNESGIYLAYDLISQVNADWEQFDVPPDPATGPFSLTISDIGTSTQVNGITVYTGVHGTFTENLGSNPEVDTSIISIAGSF